jgi:hypothetical protein
MRALPALVAAALVVAALAAGVALDPGTGVSPASDAADVATPVPVATPSQPSPGPPSRRSTTTDPGDPLAVAPGNDSRPVHVLDIPPTQVTRTAIDRRTVDLGPALGFAANGSSYRLKTLATIERVESAEEPEVRRARVLDAVAELETGIETLRTARSEAVAAYAAGDLTARGLLVRLARVDARARALDQRRARLAAVAADSEALTEADANRISAVRVKLDTFHGPVREHVVSVLRGEAPPTRFYVAAGPDSVVLSMIRGDRYVREVFRGDLRTVDGQQVGIEGATVAFRGAYPVVYDTLVNNTTDVAGQAGTFRVQLRHSRGGLVAYVDGGSGRVFRELQTRPLSTFGRNDTVTSTRDGFRLTINRTYAGGPMRVSVVDAATGEPANFTITMGPPQGESTTVGATGPDGVLWTLAPTGQFTVVAIDGTTVVPSGTMRPAPTPAIRPPANESTPTPTGTPATTPAPANARPPSPSPSSPSPPSPSASPGRP